MHETARMILINPDFYFTVSNPASVEIKIKGSRFIAILDMVADKPAAEKFIQNIRQMYHDATHNCFAYRINKSIYRYSDDGEPSGTAGKPILVMLDKYKLMKTALVVTRYFGGTKLGTGGLIRAYSSSAENLIREARIVKNNNYKSLHIHYPFAMISKVQHLVRKYKGRIEQDSNPQGVIAQVEIAPSKVQKFTDQVLEITAARAVIKEDDSN
jgi:uncharacterized YigZ family protein